MTRRLYPDRTRFLRRLLLLLLPLGFFWLTLRPAFTPEQAFRQTMDRLYFRSYVIQADGDASDLLYQTSGSRWFAAREGDYQLFAVIAPTGRSYAPYRAVCDWVVLDTAAPIDVDWFGHGLLVHVDVPAAALRMDRSGEPVSIRACPLTDCLWYLETEQALLDAHITALDKSGRVLACVDAAPF